MWRICGGVFNSATTPNTSPNVPVNSKTNCKIKTTLNFSANIFTKCFVNFQVTWNHLSSMSIQMDWRAAPALLKAKTGIFLLFFSPNGEKTFSTPSGWTTFFLRPTVKKPFYWRLTVEKTWFFELGDVQ